MSTCMYNDELAIRCERWCWGRNSSCKPGSGTRCSLTDTPTQGTVPGTSLTCHEHRCRLRECEPTKRMCTSGVDVHYLRSRGRSRVPLHVICNVQLPNSVRRGWGNSLLQGPVRRRNTGIVPWAGATGLLDRPTQGQGFVMDHYPIVRTGAVSDNSLSDNLRSTVCRVDALLWSTARRANAGRGDAGLPVDDALCSPESALCTRTAATLGRLGRRGVLLSAQICL